MPRFLCPVSHSVPQSENHRILAWPELLLQVQLQRAFEVALGVEGILVLDGCLCRGEQRLAGSVDKRDAVFDVDVVLLAVAVAGELEARPEGIPGMEDGVQERVGVFLRAQETEVAHGQRLAALDVASAHRDLDFGVGGLL